MSAVGRTRCVVAASYLCTFVAVGSGGTSEVVPVSGRASCPVPTGRSRSIGTIVQEYSGTAGAPAIGRSGCIEHADSANR